MESRICVYLFIHIYIYLNLYIYIYIKSKKFQIPKVIHTPHHTYLQTGTHTTIVTTHQLPMDVYALLSESVFT